MGCAVFFFFSLTVAFITVIDDITKTSHAHSEKSEGAREKASIYGAWLLGSDISRFTFFVAEEKHNLIDQTQLGLSVEAFKIFKNICRT